jgi:hypothetical protein
LKRKNTSSHRSLGRAIDAGSALLSAPVLLSVLGRKRAPVREVEAQIVTDEELRALGKGDATSIAEEGAAEPPPIAQVATEDETVMSAAPEVFDDEGDQTPAEPEAPAEPHARTEPDAPIEPVVPIQPDAPIQPDPPAQPDPPTQPAAQVAPSVSTEEWTCEIALWREHDEAVLYARSFHGEEELTIAESPRFHVSGDGVPEQSTASLDAHGRLCEELARDGWERVGRGVDWYNDRFRRDFSVAALTASLATRIVFARRP